MTQKVPNTDPFVQVQFRTLQILSLSIAIAAAALVMLHLHYNKDRLLAPALAAFFITPSVLSPFVYRFTGSINIAGACFCVPLALATWGTTFLVGGISAQIAPVLVVIPLFAAYFLEQRFALITSALNILVILGMYGLGLTNNVDTSAVLTGQPALHVSVSVLAALGFIAGTLSLTFMRYYRKVLDDLTDAKVQSEEASRAKSNFLATMSHEIRTPMNGIMGMLDLLVQSGLGGKQDSYAHTARSSADDLMTILNDILDISKLDAGQVHIEKVAMNPRQMISEIVSLYASNAEDKGLSLRGSISDDVPQWVEGDPTRVRQILANLVSNAIKFTEQGAVDILLWSECDQDALKIGVEVIDTGIGIPDDAQPFLFDRFTQADATTTRRYGGTGLGLAICKQLIEQMDGEIELQSTVGVGTRIRFTLPTVRREKPQVAIQVENDHQFDIEGRNVLVVEDNPINQRTIQTFLETAGLTVTIAENGRCALGLIADEQFDIILMDIQMPVMDGPTTTRHIRALPGPVANIPIVALTANAMSGDREKYLAKGMDEYVSKPIDFHQLIHVIGRLTDGTGHQQKRVPTHPSSSASQKPPPISEESDKALQELLDEIG